jgi:SAM-dependent methyltransferase
MKKSFVHLHGASVDETTPIRSSKHYETSYFDWQSAIGDFGGWANRSKFAKYISKNSSVLDFGCGGGALLAGFDCRMKVGVEVNEVAAKAASKKGIEVYSSSAAVPENYVDVIISNNALEHTLHPLAELETLRGKVRKGGVVVFVVPCESILKCYRPHDINHHLYSWSPMCLGNLFTEAGYRVIESKAYIHKWPPGYQFVAKACGRGVFDFVCRVYGHLERSWFQVRVIAENA